VLIQTLRELEAKGLVERQVLPIVPRHPDYTLTPSGQALRDPLLELREWGKTHLPPTLDQQLVAR
jgi:DNA-binding HxlR family transcriptional regulator